MESTNQQLHAMILNIDPKFSLYLLYLRYKEYSEKLSALRGSVNHSVFKRLNETSGVFVSFFKGMTNLTTTKKDKLEYVIGSKNGIGKHEGKFHHTAVDNFTWSNIVEYYILVNYYNPSLRVPIVNDIYDTKSKRPLGNTEFREEYVDEIKKIDPKFDLKDLYASMLEQKKNADLLSPKLLKYITENYNRMDSMYYSGDVAVFLYEEGEEDVKCTYEEFKQMVDNLYYGDNAGISMLKINSWEFTTL